jgi:hypothetical protein
MRLPVRLQLLPTAEGRRKLPIWSGYRPDSDIGDRLADGEIHYRMGRIAHLANQPLSPGDESEAAIDPYRADGWSAIRPGAQLSCYEGHGRLAVRPSSASRRTPVRVTRRTDRVTWPSAS